LLAGAWPAGLTINERRLLLHADREQGSAGRAQEVADAGPDHVLAEDLTLMIVAATILLEHDQRESAASLVDRALLLEPGSAALQELHRSLQLNR